MEVRPWHYLSLTGLMGISAVTLPLLKVVSLFYNFI